MEFPFILTNMLAEEKFTPEALTDIMGASIDRQLFDALIEISNELTIARIDRLFGLSLNSGYRSSHVGKITQYTGKEIGYFWEFLNEIGIIREAHEVLDLELNVSEFNIMYYKVYRFIYPFITKNYKKHDYEWDGDKWI